MSDGLLVRMMLLGRHFDETTIYRAAAAFADVIVSSLAGVDSCSVVVLVLAVVAVSSEPGLDAVGPNFQEPPIRRARPVRRIVHVPGSRVVRLPRELAERHRAVHRVRQNVVDKVRGDDAACQNGGLHSVVAGGRRCEDVRPWTTTAVLHPG